MPMKQSVRTLCVCSTLYVATLCVQLDHFTKTRWGEKDSTTSGLPPLLVSLLVPLFSLTFRHVARRRDVGVRLVLLAYIVPVRGGACTMQADVVCTMV
jgi:hypothetical protein